jgi:transposase-like protein
MNEKKRASHEILLRQQIVRVVRNGQSPRVVACHYKVSARFVRYWCNRAGDHRLDRVDWTDHRTTKHQTHNRTNTKIERCIIKLRKNLKNKSALDEHGALAIQREMVSMNCPVVPALRTINLILKRSDCIDGKRRIRYKSPPLGWYLPDVANGSAELDSYDYV